MTEAEWLACTAPKAMMTILRKSERASNRKLRLLASACCRHAENVVTHQSLLRAIETAERYADGQARYGEMVQVAKGIEAFLCSANETEGMVAGGVWHLVTMGVWWNLWPIRRTERTIFALLRSEQGVATRLAPLFRCIFGNPFRPTTINPSWVESNAGTVVAEGIYADGAFDRLPGLADALEDAGCHDADILGHCRNPGPHVRGCWVVDLLTGRS